MQSQSGEGVGEQRQNSRFLRALRLAGRLRCDGQRGSNVAILKETGRTAMRCRWFVATSLFVTAQLFYGIPKSHAADLQWEVENPYRFIKHEASFAAHEKAFDAVRGAAGQPLPSNILWRVERRLNDPDCKNRAT